MRHPTFRFRSPQAAAGLFALVLVLDSTTAQEIRSQNGGGPWSSAATWVRISGTGALPAAGDHVIVTAGNPVVLDVGSGTDNLAHLEIHDSLTVLDTQDYKLGVSRIDVGGPASHVTGNPQQPGSFVVGSPAAPFQHLFLINLTKAFLASGYVLSPASPEHQSFVVHGASNLQLHGRNVDASGQPRRAWLRLQNNGTLNPGDTSMVLEANPGWSVGDRVVLTPTDFDHNEFEIVQLTSVTGSTVQFLPALTKRHNGVVELGLVDERAEVGLLSHNIQITGDVTTNGVITRGAHVMFHNRMGADPQPTVNLSQVEFVNLGWKGALGRYPVHFHLLRSMAGSWVRACSIWNCFNRAITVHGTDDLEVSDCVTFDTFGHAVYFEDKSERRNQMLRNLVLRPRLPGTNGVPGTMPPGVTNLGDPWSPTTGSATVPYFNGSDPEVACFWITHTDNTIVGNVACGSDRHGYWYDPSTNILTLPNGTQLGAGLWQAPPVTFVGNVAHANQVHGFWNDFTRLLPNDPALSPPQSAEHVFADYTAYKNRFAGIWNRSYGVSRWLNARLADNRLGAYLASEGFQTDGLAILSPPPLFDFPFTGAPGMSLQTMEGGVVIGESSNNPGSLPVPGAPFVERKGVELYDGMLLLSGIQFRDFVTTQLSAPITLPWGQVTHRVAMAVTSQSFHSVDVPGDPWAVDARTGLVLCSFTNCGANPVLFPIPHPPGSPAIAGVHNAVPGVPTWSPNGVTSAMIFDVTGSVPGNAPGSYVVNDTPLLRPGTWTAPAPIFSTYASPVFVPGPGTAGNDAYASALLSIDSKTGPSTWVNTAINFIRVSATTRGNTLDVFDALRSDINQAQKRFPANVLLTRPGATPERYEVSYPAGAAPPAKFSLRLQFSEKGRSAVFGVAYSTTTPPTSVVATHVLFPGFSLPLTAVNSRNAVEGGTGFEFFWDSANGRLWLRPTLLDFTAAGLGASPIHPLLSGREMTIQVQ